MVIILFVFFFLEFTFNLSDSFLMVWNFFLCFFFLFSKTFIFLLLDNVFKFLQIQLFEHQLFVPNVNLFFQNSDFYYGRSIFITNCILFFDFGKIIDELSLLILKFWEVTFDFDNELVHFFFVFVRISVFSVFISISILDLFGISKLLIDLLQLTNVFLNICVSLISCGWYFAIMHLTFN